MTRPALHSYDLLKGVVAVVLLIVIAILLLQGRAGVPSPDPAAPGNDIALPEFGGSNVGPNDILTLVGTGQPGATVELWTGDVRLAAVVVDPSGGWSWTGPLAPGDYQLIARTVDASGEVLNETPAITMSVPRAMIQAARPVVNPPLVGEGGRLSLSGTGQPGTTIELWAGDTLLGQAPVAADGTWTWDGTLAPGDYQVIARTVDASGQRLNEARGEPFTIAPEPTDTPPAPAPTATPRPPTATATPEPPTATAAPASPTATATPEPPTAVPASPTATATPETATATATVPATPGEGQAYVVQRGDTLIDLALRFYGDWKLWRLILEATNERAAMDPTFHVIDNPGLIKPGWKIWIPAQ